MTMKSFARIESEKVAERLDAEELPPFHVSLIWVTCEPEVKVGWLMIDDSLMPPSLPVVSQVEQQADGRAWRDNAIESVKWLRERHRDELDLALEPTFSTEQFKELLLYMQALRDWPQSPDFPDIELRPIAPSWIAEQVE